jgi:Kef-type K+ transport system membrane component KefB
MRVRGNFLIVATALLLGLAALAHVAGSASIIGAFAAGIILAGTKQKHKIEEQIRPVADLFTPLFFLSIGASVDPRAWNPVDPAARGTLVAGAVLTIIAIGGKLVSGWAVPWQRFDRLVVGLGMMPRGEVGLIFAQIGLATGLLSEALFSAILLMVIATTLLAPPLLTLAFRRAERPA